MLDVLDVDPIDSEKLSGFISAITRIPRTAYRMQSAVRSGLGLRLTVDSLIVVGLDKQ